MDIAFSSNENWVEFHQPLCMLALSLSPHIDPEKDA